jgi:hypothetical protein
MEYSFKDSLRPGAKKKVSKDEKRELGDESTPADLPKVGEKRAVEDSKEEPPAKQVQIEDAFWEKYKYVGENTIGTREDPYLGYSLVIFKERVSQERVYEMIFWSADTGQFYPFGAGEEAFEAYKTGGDFPCTQYLNPTKDKFTQWLRAYVKHITSGGISHTPASELDIESSPTHEMKFHFCPSTGQSTKRAQ